MSKIDSSKLAGKGKNEASKIDLTKRKITPENINRTLTKEEEEYLELSLQATPEQRIRWLFDNCRKK